MNFLLSLRKVDDEDALDCALNHYVRYNLLFIDELGYLRIKHDAANFFQLSNARYERKSTIITSNNDLSSGVNNERIPLKIKGLSSVG